MASLTRDDLAGSAGGPLRRGQVVTLVLLGAALWFLAAVLLRFVGPMGAFEGVGLIALYGLTVPGTFPFILLAQQLAKLGRDQIAIGVAVATAAAALLDGVALSQFPTLYGADAKAVAGAGAAILWGAGVALLLGLLMNRPTRG